MNRHFEARMSKSVKAITLVGHLVVFIIPFADLNQHVDDALWISIFMLNILGITFLLRPFQYIVSKDQLVIKKYLFPKKIEINNIESIISVEYKDLKVWLRLFGSGGFWGWYGFFYTSNYAVVNMQCSEKGNLVLIITKDGKKIVVSPFEKQLFMEEISLQIDKNLKFETLDFVS